MHGLHLTSGEAKLTAAGDILRTAAGVGTRATPAAGPPGTPVPAAPALAAPHQPARRLTWAAALVGAACAAAFCVGLWVRLWALAHFGLESDEAITGLMADGILRGHLPAFYWGQHYGGVEPYLVAAMFAVFGHSAYVVNLTSAVLSAAACALVFSLGRVVFGRNGPAAVAACLAWAWPEPTLWDATRSTGFRGATLVCGLAVLVLAFRLVQRPPSVVGWVLLGGATGLGIWSSPEIVYFLVPAALLLAWAVATRSLRLRPRHLVAGAGALVLGALPWIVDNLHTGFASLHNTIQGPPTTYLERLHVFFGGMLPLLLGLRTGSGWVFGPAASVGLYEAAGLLVVGSLYGLLRWGPRDAWALVVFVAGFPFLYAALPPTIYWQDGRYGVLLPAVLVVVVVGGWALLLHRVDLRRPSPAATRAVAGALVIAIALASTAFELHTELPAARPSQTLLPVGNDAAGAVARSLGAHGVTEVVGSYWTAYDLDFLCHGALTATPLQHVRLPGLYDRVIRSHHVAWLFVGPTPADAREAIAAFQNTQLDPATVPLGQFTARLSARGVPYATVRAGPMVAVVPRGYAPDQLLGLT